MADEGQARRLSLIGTVTTIAGVAGVAGSDDGPARTAHLNTPSGIADSSNNVIRLLTPAGSRRRAARP